MRAGRAVVSAARVSVSRYGDGFAVWVKGPRSVRRVVCSGLPAVWRVLEHLYAGHGAIRGGAVGCPECAREWRARGGDRG